MVDTVGGRFCAAHFLHFLIRPAKDNDGLGNNQMRNAYGTLSRRLSDSMLSLTAPKKSKATGAVPLCSAGTLYYRYRYSAYCILHRYCG